MRNYLIIGVAALAVAACSDKGADADGDGKVSDTEAKAEMSAGGAMATKPGLWEVNTRYSKVEVTGVPEAQAAQMKAQAAKGVTIKSCMTKEQVEKPNPDFFGETSGANCTFDELNRSGNKMQIAMTCKPGGNIVLTSKMNGVFAEETYKLDTEQSMSGGPMGTLKMIGVVEGKRVGDCPA